MERSSKLCVIRLISISIFGRTLPRTSALGIVESMDLVPEEEGGNLFLVNGSMTPLKSAGAAYQTYDEKLVRNFIKEIKIFPDKLTITVKSGAHEDITI